MNETNTQQTITLRDIWELFWQRLVIILLVSALVVAVFFVYNKATYRPMYQSMATLYILGDDSYITEKSSADAYNNYALALKVVNDCNYLLSSRTVVDQLIKEMDLKTGFSTLQSRISTENPQSTRILEVTVQAETPELAKKLVDRLCELGVEKINKAMGADHVKLYEYGTYSSVPCNKTSTLTYWIVGIATAVITFGLCLLVFLLDDRIRNSETIEQTLGLSVLGEIPDSNAHHKRGYGYYGRYGAYRSYGAYAAGKNSSKKKGRV